jgi:hypothetical protein
VAFQKRGGKALGSATSVALLEGGSSLASKSAVKAETTWDKTIKSHDPVDDERTLSTDSGHPGWVGASLQGLRSDAEVPGCGGLVGTAAPCPGMLTF